MLSLDQELDAGRPCLCIPVSDGNVRYSEHYELTPEEFALVSRDSSARQALAGQCRARKNDHRLMEPPPAKRGAPCLPGGMEGLGLITSYPALDKTQENRSLMIFTDQWFSVGCDLLSRQYYLSIYVSFSGHAEGMEKYKLTPEEFERLSKEPQAMIEWAGRCQRGENDGCLMEPLLSKRGTPFYIPSPPA